jgi:hypothetical protein
MKVRALFRFVDFTGNLYILRGIFTQRLNLVKLLFHRRSNEVTCHFLPAET